MSGDVQARKRKDKRKRRADESDEVEEQEHHDPHHGHHAGICAKIIFFLLFSGLFIAMGTIFFQLHGSDVAETPIKESRYASILEDFVDEHPPDDHEEHHASADEHTEHGDDEEHTEHGDDEEHTEHDEEHTEHEAADESEEAAEDEIVEKVLIEDVELEASLPQEIIPEPPSEEEEDDNPETEFEEYEEQPEEEYSEEVSIEDLEPEEEAESVEEQKLTEPVPVPQSEDSRKNEIPDDDEKSSYPASHLTNDYDYGIRDDLDEADGMLGRAPDQALQAFLKILEKYPKSPRALYGKAQAIDRLSEVHRSNQLLEKSISIYRDVLDLPDVPDDLYKLAGSRCADRMRFRGFQAKALKVLQRMSERFPGNTDISNQVAVSFLLLGKNKEAKNLFKDIIKKKSTDGFAKAHYGFILKTEDKKYKEAIQYLQEGIQSRQPGTNDGRFYFHLGDALTREGHTEEAYKVYEEAVQLGLFLSVYQRSLYNVKSLTARPWWTPEQSTYGHYLAAIEAQWKTIRSEAVALIEDEDQGYFPESEGLKDKGIWKQFEMYVRGQRVDVNCMRAPKTCQLVENIPDAAGCTRGQIKFSLLEPGTHVWPHTGPTNCRLRAHLGLVVPANTRIRVANETRTWEEGRFIVFDDSFEHEVWNDSNAFRLVLIIDFWHPDLTESQRKSLTPI